MTGKFCGFLFIMLLASACTGAMRTPAKPEVTLIPSPFGEKPAVQVKLPDCQDWQDPHHVSNYGNSALKSFGCAHAHNLVHMLEDPHDLAGINPGDYRADAERSAHVVELYRNPPQEEGGSEETAEATVSEGGQ
ncbi:MAG TPA: CpaD family pilus assembly lipoprotein [Xanthomonadales bacterium]|nr:CpaD family pilus assembly lipoprotein [Xanthomonadales bacterium]